MGSPETRDDFNDSNPEKPKKHWDDEEVLLDLRGDYPNAYKGHLLLIKLFEEEGTPEKFWEFIAKKEYEPIPTFDEYIKRRNKKYSYEVSYNIANPNLQSATEKIEILIKAANQAREAQNLQKFKEKLLELDKFVKSLPDDLKNI